MSDALLDQIKADISKNKVMLYMKGTPDMPSCGFSFKAVEILKSLNVQFESTDILPDPDIRMTLSAHSNWPTIPQLFIDGKLIGGSDIMMDMYESGDLQEALGNAGAYGETPQVATESKEE